MPFALKHATPRLAHVLISFASSSSPTSLFHPARQEPKYGPELRMRGPGCSPASMFERKVRISRGLTSPAVYVVVTPLARNKSGIASRSSTRPLPKRSTA